MKAISCAAITMIAGCASVEDLPDSASCWRHQLETQPRNTLTFCVLGKDARMTTYYPNPGDVPTTCKAPGTAALDADSILKLSFSAGECKNLRDTAPYNMECKAEGLNQVCSFSRRIQG